MQARILVVDDAPQIRRVLETTLVAKGYEVLVAKSGEEALESLKDQPVDLIILDLMLPDLSGVEVCHEIRRFLPVPIIILSVRGAEKDKVAALDAGADDYVTKPFGIDELLARIRAAIRRSPFETISHPLKLADLTIDFEQRSVLCKGEEVHLTPKEYELLKYLVVNAGRIISHRSLLQAVWGPDYEHQTEYLRTFVTQLRKKIEPDPNLPRYILTEPWVGYRFALHELDPLKKPAKSRT
jgi:two-component system KDP operon response regulator KdpE